MRAILALAAFVLTCAFQTPPDLARGPRTLQQIQPTERIEPNRPSPLDPDEAARRIQQIVGPWDVMCRPGGAAALDLNHLGEAEQVHARPARGSWRLRLVFQRAARGYEHAPLAPGECAQARAPLPGSAIVAYRLLEVTGTRLEAFPDTGLSVLRVAPAPSAVEVQTADSVFSSLLWRATTGPDGRNMRVHGSFAPPFAPFRMRLEQCNSKCGRAATPGSYYVRSVAEE